MIGRGEKGEGRKIENGWWFMNVIFEFASENCCINILKFFAKLFPWKWKGMDSSGGNYHVVGYFVREIRNMENKFLHFA